MTSGFIARPHRPQEPTIAASTFVERTSEAPSLHVRTRLRDLWAYREILLNLVRKELKVKYTASVLGALWSVLNPIVFLAVFSFVTRVLNNQIPDFPVFLLSGLLACTDKPTQYAGPYGRQVADAVPRIETAIGLKFKTPPKLEVRTRDQVKAFVTAFNDLMTFTFLDHAYRRSGKKGGFSP